MADEGKQRELRAKTYVEKLGYTNVIFGDSDVVRELKLKLTGGETSNCADIVGFKPNRPKDTQAIICEAKGTDVEHPLLQIGNAAAALLNRFTEERREVQLFLLVYAKRLRPIDIGNSPGPGYLAGDSNEFGIRPLIDAGTADRKAGPAKAALDMHRLDAKLTKWGTAIAKLPVYVVIDQVPSA
jgi:hypothetical protein